MSNAKSYNIDYRTLDISKRHNGGSYIWGCFLRGWSFNVPL